MDTLKLDDYIEYLKVSRETMGQDLDNFLGNNIKALEVAKEDMNRLSFALVSLLQMSGGKISIPREIVEKNNDLVYGINYFFQDGNVILELTTAEEKQ